MTALLATAALERILGRPERDLAPPVAELDGKTVLVTGAAGSIGAELVRLLDASGALVCATDIDTLDVRRPYPLDGVDYVFHLAGAKHAPDGELDPWAVVETNTIGVRNMLAAGGKLVLASTCKAADPETAYGASKLIAERMVLNAGGGVARFYNVVESFGNVFETWAGLPADVALPVTGCTRRFMGIREAASLLVWAAVLPSGRYTLAGCRSRLVEQVAAAVYPGRAQTLIARRRGDRGHEPVAAAHETLVECGVDHVRRIVSPHDPESG